MQTIIDIYIILSPLLVVCSVMGYICRGVGGFTLGLIFGPLGLIVAYTHRVYCNNESDQEHSHGY